MVLQFSEHNKEQKKINKREDIRMSHLWFRFCYECLQKVSERHTQKRKKSWNIYFVSAKECMQEESVECDVCDKVWKYYNYIYIFCFNLLNATV